MSEKMSQKDLKPGNWAIWSANQEWSRVINPYMMERVPEFRELSRLRQEGWENSLGDEHFRRQRKTADRPNKSATKFFYRMTKNIGHELHKATNAFAIAGPRSEKPQILDMGMAPGGFMSVALEYNPEANALGISLPLTQGGHKSMIPARPNLQLKFLDVTMLAADMGVSDIPPDHIDAENFFPRQIDPNRQFDLVICGGQVVRPHASHRAPYRENREARRLATVQLVLGLEHIRPGGTMVVVLHKVEAWDTLSLIRQFTKFSSVRLYKPKVGHATRSSFYMVASSVQSNRPEAISAVEGWKAVWRSATFDPDEEYWQVLRGDEQNVAEVLLDFGPELIRLGREIWDVQAKALAKAPYIKNN